MNEYEILRYVHKVGSPITGVVIGREETVIDPPRPGRLFLETSSDLPAILPYEWLVDDVSSFTPDVVPELGSRVEAVVANVVGGNLYLRARPQDLKEETIREWADFYATLDTLPFGKKIEGRVTWAAPFGLFVDLDLPYPGIIDIGHTQFISGHLLPRDVETWPKPGEKVRCVVGGARFDNRQIDLGWLPDGEA